MSMSRFLSWAAVGILLFGCSTGIQPNFRVASEKLQASALAFGDPCTKFWLEFNLRTWDPAGSGPEYWKAYGQWANSVQPSARKVLEGNMPPSELVPILMDTANRDAVNYIANLQKDIAQKHFMLPQNSGNFQLCFGKFGRRELPGNFMQQSNAWLFWADFLLAAEQLRVVQNNSEDEEFWVALYQAILVGAFNEAYSDKQIPPRITSCQLVPSVTPESIRSYVQGRTTLKQIVLDFSNLMRDSARGRCNISNLPREGNTMVRLSKSELRTRIASFLGNAKWKVLWGENVTPASELVLVARFPLGAMKGKNGGEVEEVAKERVASEGIFPFHNGWPDKTSPVEWNFQYIQRNEMSKPEEPTHFIVAKTFSDPDTCLKWIDGLPEDNFFFGEAHEVTLSLQRIRR